MKKKNPYVYLLFQLTLAFSLCIIPLSNYANHLMGSDLTWKCLQNNQYEITLKLYRDCRGSGLPPSLPVYIRCQENISPNRTSRLNLNRQSIKDVTPVCNQITSSCAANRHGIEEHKYTGIVDFDSSIFQSGCCIFRIYFSTCCRNYSITTGSAGNTYYTEALINLCNIRKSIQKECDNSPEFWNQPAAYLCCNQLFSFNNGGYDIDGDSLVFSLTSPMISDNYETDFIPPFHPTEWPMTAHCGSNQTPCPCHHGNVAEGICFNPRTGDISFIPVDCQEVGIMAIKADQYRLHENGIDWLYIGTVRREIQLQVITCSNNNPPELQDIPLITLCEGSQTCFTVRAEDPEYVDMNGSQPWKDSITLLWNQSLPNATFDIRPPFFEEKNGIQVAVREAEICWQTKEGDARPSAYHLTISASDNACPIKQMSSKGYQILVLSPEKCFDVRDKTVCFDANFTDHPDGLKKIPLDSLLLETPHNTRGNWRVTLAPDDVDPSDYPQFILDEGTSSSPFRILDLRTRQTETPETWEVTFCLDSQYHKSIYCKKARIEVSNKPEIIIDPLSPKCQEPTGRINLQDRVKPADGRWQLISGPQPDLALLSEGVYFDLNSPYGTYSFQYTHDLTGCVVQEQTHFTLHPYPEFDFTTADTSGCEPLMVSILPLVSKPTNLPLQYLWYIDSMHHITEPSPLPLAYTFQDTGTYSITLSVITDGLCTTTVSKSAYIQVHPMPTAFFTTNPTLIIPASNPVLTTYNQSWIASGDLSYVWNFGTGKPGDTSHQFSPVFAYKNRDTGSYRIRLTATSAFGCEDSYEHWLELESRVFIYAPNAFSPNLMGPEQNEHFTIKTYGVDVYHLTIYNRWGEKLFVSNRPEDGWDGMYQGIPCPAGSYMFVLRAKGIDGQWYDQKGSILLIR